MKTTNETTMTNLSPAAQAVLDALYMEELNGPQQMMARAHAAALRAAADQVAPEVYFSYTDHRDWDQGMEARNDTIREAILAIAEELENTMTDLSPQAQVVLNDAYEVLPWMARTDSATIAAAALRAAAEELQYRLFLPGTDPMVVDAKALFSLANELEAQ